jgi:hypothetical protein
MNDSDAGIRLADTLLFFLQKIRNVEHQLEALKACILANSPKPAELRAQLSDAEKMLLELDQEEEEKLHQFEAYLEFLKTGKRSDEHDA